MLLTESPTRQLRRPMHLSKLSAVMINAHANLVCWGPVVGCLPACGMHSPPLFGGVLTDSPRQQLLLRARLMALHDQFPTEKGKHTVVGDRTNTCIMHTLLPPSLPIPTLRQCGCIRLLFLNRKPTFVWCVGSVTHMTCLHGNLYGHEDILCSKRLHQRLLLPTPHSIVNSLGRTYVVSQSTTTHTLCEKHN